MSCTCGKVGFASEREARSVARRAGAGRRAGMGLSAPNRRVYRCPGDPGLWHLTSQGRVKR